MRFLKAAALLAAAAVSASALAAGNTTHDDFRETKKMLEKKVYFDHRVTLYCGYTFDRDKNVKLPDGFTTREHEERASKVEWEHVVPVERFGPHFYEWTRGSGVCIKDGRHYKGRRCANKASQEFRYIQSDMYNLFPAVGAVNASRGHLTYDEIPGDRPSFGTCKMEIRGDRAEPPSESRGRIARAMLYMAETYPDAYRITKHERRLAEKWNELYPVDQWECTRASRIAALQGNENRFVAEACRAKGLAYIGLTNNGKMSSETGEKHGEKGGLLSELLK